MPLVYRAASASAAFVLLLSAAACGGGTDTQQSADTTSADTMNAPAGTQARGDTAAMGSPSSTPADTVQVTLTNFNIDMPRTLPAGPTVFQVENAGETRHNFEVERGDMQEGFEQELVPGAGKTLRVDLRPGEYEIYCPLADHESRGMALTLTVSQPQGGS